MSAAYFDFGAAALQTVTSLNKAHAVAIAPYGRPDLFIRRTCRLGCAPVFEVVPGLSSEKRAEAIRLVFNDYPDMGYGTHYVGDKIVCGSSE